jgi:TPR repeat protein
MNAESATKAGTHLLMCVVIVAISHSFAGCSIRREKPSTADYYSLTPRDVVLKQRLGLAGDKNACVALGYYYLCTIRDFRTATVWFTKAEQLGVNGASKWALRPDQR